MSKAQATGLSRKVQAGIYSVPLGLVLGWLAPKIGINDMTPEVSAAIASLITGGVMIGAEWLVKEDFSRYNREDLEAYLKELALLESPEQVDLEGNHTLEG